MLRRLTDEGLIVVMSTYDQRLVALADEIIDLAPRLQPTAPGPASSSWNQAATPRFHNVGDGGDW